MHFTKITLTNTYNTEMYRLYNVARKLEYKVSSMQPEKKLQAVETLHKLNVICIRKPVKISFRSFPKRFQAQNFPVFVHLASFNCTIHNRLSQKR